MQVKLKEEYKLVIVGKKGWHYDELFSVLSDCPEKDRIVFAGYVKEIDLPLLYAGAALFVYPSFYEGFGIPVLEALACGVPTITSNLSSLPEVAGRGAWLVDPNNIKEIKRAMEEVLTNPVLAEKIRNSGLQQAKHFSWYKCAKETLEVYKGIAT
jgi:glycosyltransferase involved in cell wall biosynthesis